MSNLAKYAKAWVTLDGSLLSQESSVSVDRDPALQRVDTVAKGFAGVTEGARSVSITIDNAVPSSGFEVDPGRFMNFTDVVTLSIVIPNSGLQMISEGFIMSDNFSHAVSSASKLTFTFLGEWSLWE